MVGKGHCVVSGVGKHNTDSLSFAADPIASSCPDYEMVYEQLAEGRSVFHQALGVDYTAPTLGLLMEDEQDTLEAGNKGPILMAHGEGSGKSQAVENRVPTSGPPALEVSAIAGEEASELTVAQVKMMDELFVRMQPAQNH